MSLSPLGMSGLAGASLSALGGARRAEQSVAQTAQNIASYGATPAVVTGDALPEVPVMDLGADPVADQVNLMLAQRAYEANLAVLKTTDAMSRTTIDRLG
ncbi:flagellar basal body rod C-terminal domain-containing protein [Roseomonas sp. 18066]|uniref:flagellar basal body rod C-terminal domain-containing protein n=1 Tax=Roseomonas sp. 18066 TaxID=2681412 RepID=UPI001356FD35|nr:flagellar basal body rod C-terminal domain-containing protein [Roseomonas sp. 18066]